MLNLDLNLTQNFKLKEFLTSSHLTPQQLLQSLTPEILENIFILATYLQKIRNLTQKPITITSAFRTPQLNKLIGGSSNSLHLIGKAADFRIKNLDKKSLTQLLNFINTTPIGEFIIYTSNNSISRFHLAIPSLNPKKLDTLLIAKEGTKSYKPLTPDILDNLLFLPQNH